MGRGRPQEISPAAIVEAKGSWICLHEKQGLAVREHGYRLDSALRAAEMEWFMSVDVARVTEL